MTYPYIELYYDEAISKEFPRRSKRHHGGIRMTTASLQIQRITHAHQKFCTAKDEYYKAITPIGALLQDERIAKSYQNMMLSLENLSRAIVTQKDIGNHDYRHAERYSRYVSNNLYEHTRNVLYEAKGQGVDLHKADVYEYESAKLLLVRARHNLEKALRDWNEYKAGKMHEEKLTENYEESV